MQSDCLCHCVPQCTYLVMVMVEMQHYRFRCYWVRVVGHFRDYFALHHSVENNMASGKTCVDPMSITGDSL